VKGSECVWQNLHCESTLRRQGVDQLREQTRKEREREREREKKKKKKKKRKDR